MTFSSKLICGEDSEMGSDADKLNAHSEEININQMKRQDRSIEVDVLHSKFDTNSHQSMNSFMMSSRSSINLGTVP